MNADGTTNPGARNTGAYNDACEMLLRALTVPGGGESTCLRWWVEELLAEHMGADAPVAGEEPEVVENYIPWLTEAELRALDALEPDAHPRADAAAEARDGGSGKDGHPECNSAGDSEEEARRRSREAEVWWDHTERAMDACAEILRASMDHAHGITREERERCADPYAEWYGPQSFCSQADFTSVTL